MPHPYCPLAQSVEHSAVNRSVVSSSLSGAAIFVVRKSYNTQKAQDIAHLVLFCYYILCFCRWAKSLNLTAAFRRFFQKTGLELTTYRFCSIGYYNFIIIFKREQVFRSSHREFFHINIDKYSALYLASKASALIYFTF